MIRVTEKGIILVPTCTYKYIELRKDLTFAKKPNFRCGCSFCLYLPSKRKLAIFLQQFIGCKFLKLDDDKCNLNISFFRQKFLGVLKSTFINFVQINTEDIILATPKLV